MANCTRCGACCAYPWTVTATAGARVRPGHLAAGGDGYARIVWRRKPWSRGHAVCIFLRRDPAGFACPLHGTAEKPRDCRGFRCADWLATCRVDPTDRHFVGLADDFERFQAAWRADK